MRLSTRKDELIAEMDEYKLVISWYFSFIQFINNRTNNLMCNR